MPKMTASHFLAAALRRHNTFRSNLSSDEKSDSNSDSFVSRSPEDLIPKALQHNDLGYVSQRPLRGHIAAHTPGNLKSCLR